MTKLTPAQFRTLWEAFKQGQLTDEKLAVLADACRNRWAKHGCMAYLDDLKEVEAVLKGKTT